MRPDTKFVSAFLIIAVAMILSGAKSGEECKPSRAATCYPDNCTPCYCLGPDNPMANAPVRPLTCNGDFVIDLAGLYWRAEQDGMEYAIDNQVPGSDALTVNAGLNNLIDADYISPSSRWNWGFKLGAGYNSVCDGWDVGLLWTWYQNSSTTHSEAESSDNHTLLPLWSAFQYPNAGQAPILFANTIDSFWKLNLNLFDLDLGREFWTSKYLSFHPHVGLRVAYIDQKFEIMHKGGSWNDPGLSLNFNGWVDLDNDFKGVGIRSGFATAWNVGCGWALQGDLAASIIYGRFSLDHDESLRQAESPFSKNRILETNESFRASRAIVDMGLGIRWAGMVCDCQYGLSFTLAWEQHLFLHQNQLWRVNRFGGTNGTGIFNNSGENVLQQRRGTLCTQGVSLTGIFSF